MAGNKYIARVSGKNKEVAAIQSSAGAGDAGKIPAVDSSGLLDISFMPVGVAAEVTIAASFEDLVAGNFVNLFLSGGVIKVRKADATDATKPANGFVLANVTSPANATVYRESNTNTALSGLTIGSDYYLSTTPGGVTIAPGPVAAGNLNQRLGVAASATSLVFEDGPASAVEIS